MEIEIVDTDDARTETVLAGLRRYNRQFSQGTSQPLNVFAQEQQQTVGGLTGVTYGGWLHVDELWVSEAARGQSIGTQLLLAAEREALRRGCSGSTLDTYSFQALAFYQKLGYRQFGVLDGYAGRYQRFYFQKALTPAQPAAQV